MTRIGLLVISVVAGALLALGAAFAVTSILNSAQQSPVNSSPYNYGSH